YQGLIGDRRSHANPVLTCKGRRRRPRRSVAVSSARELRDRSVGGEIPGSDDEATHIFEALVEASELDDAAPWTGRSEKPQPGRPQTDTARRSTTIRSLRPASGQPACRWLGAPTSRPICNASPNLGHRAGCSSGPEGGIPKRRNFNRVWKKPLR